MIKSKKGLIILLGGIGLMIIFILFINSYEFIGGMVVTITLGVITGIIIKITEPFAEITKPFIKKTIKHLGFAMEDVAEKGEVINQGEIMDHSNAKIDELKYKDKIIKHLDASNIEIDRIDISNGKIGRIDVSESEIKNELDATNAKINLLDASNAKIEKISVNKGIINILDVSDANIGILDLSDAEIIDLDFSNATIDILIGLDKLREFSLLIDTSGATIKKTV